MLVRVLITNKESKYLPGYIVTPEMYAHVLFLLTSNSQGYIAVARWQAGIGERQKEYAGVCGVETPLARQKDDGTYELLVPHSDTLQSLFLTAFYRDGSVLRVFLGSGDRAMIVRHAVNGEVGEAGERIDQAIEALHTRRMHPDLMFSIVAVSVLAFFCLVFLFLHAWLASALTVLVGLVAAIPIYQRKTGYLRPRRSRIGAMYTTIGLTPEDRRQVIVAVAAPLVVGVIAFLFGLLIPGR